MRPRHKTKRYSVSFYFLEGRLTPSGNYWGFDRSFQHFCLSSPPWQSLYALLGEPRFIRAYRDRTAASAAAVGVGLQSFDIKESSLIIFLRRCHYILPGDFISLLSWQCYWPSSPGDGVFARRHFWWRLPQNRATRNKRSDFNPLPFSLSLCCLLAHS